MLSPDSEFFRYFGSNGELPARNPNPAAALAPAPVPESAVPTTQGPALDGLGIDETPVPDLTLENGQTLAPTVGTEVPPPVEAAPTTPAPAEAAPAAPAETTPAPAAVELAPAPAPADGAAPATTPDPQAPAFAPGRSFPAPASVAHQPFVRWR